MRTSRLLGIGSAVFLLGLAGCGTARNFIPGDRALIDPPLYRVYGGVRYDCEILGKTDGWGHPDLSWFFKPISFFDLPLSLALDTVTLPVTVIIALTGGGEAEATPKAQPEAPKSKDR